MNDNGCVVRDRGGHAVWGIGIENHLALIGRTKIPFKDVVDPPRVAAVQVRNAHRAMLIRIVFILAKRFQSFLVPCRGDDIIRIGIAKTLDKYLVVQ